MSLSDAARLFEAGQLGQAQALIERVITATPGDPSAHALAAEILDATGQAPAALAAVDRSLALAPDYAPALALKAWHAQRQGRSADALALYQRALPALQTNALIFYRYALALHAQGQAQATHEALTRAAELAPAWPAPRIDLGHLALGAGRAREALAHYRSAQALAAAPPVLSRFIAEALLADGDPRAALAAFTQALTQMPDDAAALIGNARCLAALDAPLGQRVTAWGRAAQRAPSGWSHTQHALALLSAGDFPAAHQSLARALALEPDFLPAAWTALQYPQAAIYPDTAAVDAFRQAWDQGFAQLAPRLVAAAPAAALAAIGVASNFYRHYIDTDLLDVQTRYATLLSTITDAAVVLPIAPRPPRRPGARLRLALCSAHFFDHTILRLFGPMLAALDRGRFEVHGFSSGRIDATAQAFAATLDGWTRLSATLPEASAAINAFAPDLLLYPDIGMDPLSQALGSLRLAPWQAVLWGHPVTTGSAAIDCFISVAAMEPPDGATHYRESLALLPGVGCCFSVPDQTPEIPPELGARDRARCEIGLVQSSVKLLPQHDALLVQLLGAAPHARLHLTPSNNPNISAALRARLAHALDAAGLEPDHALGITRGLPRAQFFGLARRLDFALDSHGWSGGNTALELLWCDLPIVTCPGASLRTRHTAAMLTLLELPQLIARDSDDWLRIALELARSPDLRAELRATISARKLRLFEDRRVAAALEDILAQRAQ